MVAAKDAGAVDGEPSLMPIWRYAVRATRAGPRRHMQGILPPNKEGPLDNVKPVYIYITESVL